VNPSQEISGEGECKVVAGTQALEDHLPGLARANDKRSNLILVAHDGEEALRRVRTGSDDKVDFMISWNLDAVRAHAVGPELDLDSKLGQGGVAVLGLIGRIRPR
jgi:hypothetical protein